MPLEVPGSSLEVPGARTNDNGRRCSFKRLCQGVPPDGARKCFTRHRCAFVMLEIGLRVVDMKTQQRKLNKCLAARSVLHSTQERVAQSKKELAVAAKLEKAVQAFHVAFCSWRGI